MELIHVDRDIVVCIKPPRIVSTDEPGGLPDLIREALKDPNIRTVHWLDRVGSGKNQKSSLGTVPPDPVR